MKLKFAIILQNQEMSSIVAWDYISPMPEKEGTHSENGRRDHHFSIYIYTCD